jgi:hypothetical protein
MRARVAQASQANRAPECRPLDASGFGHGQDTPEVTQQADAHRRMQSSRLVSSRLSLCGQVDRRGGPHGIRGGSIPYFGIKSVIKWSLYCGALAVSFRRREPSRRPAAAVRGTIVDRTALGTIAAPGLRGIRDWTGSTREHRVVAWDRGRRIPVGAPDPAGSTIRSGTRALRLPPRTVSRGIAVRRTAHARVV